jgi:hypothetical protein
VTTMADEADRAQVIEEAEREQAIANAIKPLAVGVPGECDYCGEDSPRLIDGGCAPCRERRRLG